MRLHVTTVATHSERYFPALLASCSRFGIDLQVLGYKRRWEGYAFKFRLMLQFLASLPPDDIVMFVDAFDVALLQPPDVILERFLESGAQILVASDQGEPYMAAHPNPVVRFFVRRLFPQVTPNVWINTGSYMGFAGAIHDLLRAVERDNAGGFAAVGDDQAMLAKFCASHPGWIDVDERCRIFLTLYGGHPLTLSNEIRLGKRTDIRVVRDDNDVPWLMNTGTGTLPAVVHGPCDTRLDEVLEALGYDLDESIKSYTTWDHYRYMFRGFYWHGKLFLDWLATVLLFILAVLITIFLLFRWLKRRVLNRTSQTPQTSSQTLSQKSRTFQNPSERPQTSQKMRPANPRID